MSQAWDKAEQTTRMVLASQPNVKQLVLDSPPGAGKTGVVERLAIQGAWLHGERVMLATQTNGQAFDLARRIASGWKDRPVHLYIRRGLPTPDDLVDIANLQIIEDLHALPGGGCIVIANAAKWSYADLDGAQFDLMVIDEAYQLRDSGFAQIAGMAGRHVLVGDPGQIAPVTSADVSRWQAMEDGPHVPAPRALLARRPKQTVHLALPATRRLPEDSVQFVQPAFYPGLNFAATSAPGDRQLLVSTDGKDPLDYALDLAASGKSIVHIEMPAKTTGEFDGEIATQMVAFIHRMLEGEARISDDGRHKALAAEDVGIVCAHRSQVYAVQQALGEDLADVHVETADRWQGLERAVMLVHHPLSGRLHIGGFQLDPGRLCVMLSRHRVACFIFSRQGLLGKLQALAPQVERVLGQEEDPAHRGAAAHRVLLEELAGQERVLTINPTPGNANTEPEEPRHTGKTTA